MKTSILIAVICSIGYFIHQKTETLQFDFLKFQKETSEASFEISNQTNKHTTVLSSPQKTSQNSLSLIFQFIKVAFFPITGIVLLMWIAASFGIFNSFQNLKK